MIIPIGTIMPDVTTARDFGALIRSARKRAGLTLIECAGANGVGVRFLSELERGKETAALGLALRIARSLGLQIRISAPEGE
jgi:transcriptional regulator with XRE-family HTH domain